MKIKTSELSSAALDWAVAKADGIPMRHDPMAIDQKHWWVMKHTPWPDTPAYRIGGKYSPSTNWIQGGPIIERELIALDQHWRNVTSEHPGGWEWSAAVVGEDPKQVWINGPTPLIAAMRCYVASKLGYEVDVPQELL